ncbi:Chromodomain-helicase-DNA-binding protein 3 [Chlorella vulgaris]
MDDMVIDLCCDDDSSSPDGASDKQEEQEEEEVKHSEAAKALASSHPADFLHLCLCIRYALGLRATSGPADLERVLSTHHLEGQALRLQGSDGTVLGRGCLEQHKLQTRVACACRFCGVHRRRLGLKEFAAHCNLNETPAALALSEAFVLEASNRSLQQVVDLVNDPLLAAAAAAADIDLHSDRCHSCGDGGELLCCDGCTAAFHLSCTGLPEVPENDWICPLCVSERTASGRRGVPQALAAAPAGPPAGASGDVAALATEFKSQQRQHELPAVQTQGTQQRLEVARPAVAATATINAEGGQKRGREEQQQHGAKQQKILLVIKKPQAPAQLMPAAGGGRAVNSSSQPAPGLHATPAIPLDRAPLVPSKAAEAPQPAALPPSPPAALPLSAPAAAAAAGPPPASNAPPAAAVAAVPVPSRVVGSAASLPWSPPLAAAAAAPPSLPGLAAVPPALPGAVDSAPGPAGTDPSRSHSPGGKPQARLVTPMQAKGSGSEGRAGASDRGPCEAVPGSLPQPPLDRQDTQHKAQHVQQAQPLSQPAEQHGMQQVASTQQAIDPGQPAGPPVMQQQQQSLETGQRLSGTPAVTHAAFATESRRFMTLLRLLQEAAVPEDDLEAFLRHYARLASPQRSHALQQLQASGAASKARSLVSGLVRGQL